MKQERKFLDEAFAYMFSNPKFKDYLFYAHILGQCTTRITDTLPAPAGVAFVRDHFELFVNPDMMKEFPINERIGILKHEALHIIQGHLGKRFEGSNHRVMNLGTDCAINQMINRSDLPDGVIYPDSLGRMLWGWANPEELQKLMLEALRRNLDETDTRKFIENKSGTITVQPNLSSEEYYNLIMEYIPKDENGEPDFGSGEGSEGSDCPDCDGSGETQDSEGSEGSECETCGGSGKQKRFKPTEWGELDDHSQHGNDTEGVSEEFLKERTKNLLEKAKEATLATNGTLPQDYSEMIALHSPKQSEVPWQKLLQNVASNTKKNTRETYMRKSRRFRSRPDIKGKLPERTFTLLSIADVSGSMSDYGVRTCLSEQVYICKKMDIEAHLIQVDVNAMPSIKLTGNVKTFERKASGGTLMYPGIEQAQREKLQYDAVVILTDGGLCNSDIEAFLNVKAPVIWIVTNEYNEDLERFRIGGMKAARLKISREGNVKQHSSGMSYSTFS